MLKVKLLVKHSPDCVTVRDPEQTARRGGGAFTWYTPLDPPQVVMLDAGGGRRGQSMTRYRWLKVICADDRRCAAVAVVRLDTFAVEIQAALDEQGKR